MVMLPAMRELPPVSGPPTRMASRSLTSGVCRPARSELGYAFAVGRPADGDTLPFPHRSVSPDEPEAFERDHMPQDDRAVDAQVVAQMGGGHGLERKASEYLGADSAADDVDGCAYLLRLARDRRQAGHACILPELREAVTKGLVYRDA